jgi:hypothetical protein
VLPVPVVLPGHAMRMVIGVVTTNSMFHSHE